jgi:hypothetical protein
MANPPAASAASPPEVPCVRAVTTRAVLLGLVLIPVNVYWVIQSEMRWYLILTLNPLFVTPVIFLLVLLGLNAVLRAARPAWAFTAGELLVVYVMLTVSCTVATHDFAINLIGALSYGVPNATPENRWADAILPYIPQWAIVRDAHALQAFMDGGFSLYSREMLLPWLVPLAVWMGFMLVLFGTMLCLNTLVRKAWIEETKLSFPAVRLPLAIVGLETPKLWRSSLLWVGVALPILTGTLNGLAELYPALPHFQTRTRWLYFTTPPWNRISLPYSFYPFAIGLCYFVPAEVLFSCWFFYLFIKAQTILGHYVGLSMVPGYPFGDDQSIGAWLTYALLSLYLTRHQWSRLLRNLLGRESLGDEKELLPYRTAFYGVVGGVAALVAFWMVIGMTLLPAVIAVLLYLLVAFAVTRIRAEAGSQHTIWGVEPMDSFTLVDSSLLGRSNLIGAGLNHWFWRANRSHAMPAQLEGLRIWHGAGLAPRSLLWPMVLATILSVVAGPWACLHVGYREGALSKCLGYSRWTGTEIYGWLSNALTAGQTFSWPRWFAVFAASGLTLGLWALQMRFTWFPLHPLGYCAGPMLVWIWLPFFIAWVIKSVVIRYGGQRVYRRLIPFFFGLIVGDYLTGAVWSLISQTFQFAGYQIFH